MTDITKELHKTDEQIAKLEADLMTCEPSKAADLAQRIGVLQVTRDALSRRLQSDQQAARARDVAGLAREFETAQQLMGEAQQRESQATLVKIAARAVMTEAAAQYKRFHDADHLEAYLAALCTYERANFVQFTLAAESLAALKSVNEAEKRLHQAQAALA